MSTHTEPRVLRTVSPLEVTASMVASEFYVPLSQAHDMLRETDLAGASWTREVGATLVHLDSNGLEVTAL